LRRAEAAAPARFPFFGIAERLTRLVFPNDLGTSSPPVALSPSHAAATGSNERLSANNLDLSGGGLFLVGYRIDWIILTVIVLNSRIMWRGSFKIVQGLLQNGL